MARPGGAALAARRQQASCRGSKPAQGEPSTASRTRRSRKLTPSRGAMMGGGAIFGSLLLRGRDGRKLRARLCSRHDRAACRGMMRAGGVDGRSRTAWAARARGLPAQRRAPAARACARACRWADGGGARRRAARGQWRSPAAARERAMLPSGAPRREGRRAPLRARSRVERLEARRAANVAIARHARRIATLTEPREPARRLRGRAEGAAMGTPATLRGARRPRVSACCHANAAATVIGSTACRSPAGSPRSSAAPTSASEAVNQGRSHSCRSGDDVTGDAPPASSSAQEKHPAFAAGAAAPRRGTHARRCGSAMASPASAAQYLAVFWAASVRGRAAAARLPVARGGRCAADPQDQPRSRPSSRWPRCVYCGRGAAPSAAISTLADVCRRHAAVNPGRAEGRAACRVRRRQARRRRRRNGGLAACGALRRPLRRQAAALRVLAWPGSARDRDR